MAATVSYAVGSAVLAASGSFAVASAVSTAVSLAITAAPVVISAIAADRQRKAAAAQAALSNDDRALQQAIPKSAPEHMLLLGYAHIAGTPFFIRGGKGNRPYLYKGFLLAAHECDGLDSVWINGQQVFIDSDGFATSTPFNDGSTQFIRVSFRAGTLAQAIDPILDNDFAAIPSTYRQRGQCTAVIKAHYGTGGSRDAQDDKHRELYGDGEFTPLFRVRGAKVYDPRAPSHVLGDSDTYEWTRNAALNAAHFLVWKYKDMQDRIDWDRIALAADVCDKIRYSADGTAFPQFTLDGAIFSNDPVADTIQALLSACGGRLIRRAGKFYVYPAQTETAVGTLHAGNLRGALQYSNGLPRGQLTNELHPEFMSPERDYKIVPGPVISVTADQTTDGEVRSRTERYPFTEYHYRAQRLAQIDYREGRQQETLVAGVDMSALQWDAGRIVNVDLDAFLPELTGSWRIERKSWSDDLMGYVLELKKYDSSIIEFDPTTDEQEFEVEDVV